MSKKRSPADRWKAVAGELGRMSKERVSMNQSESLNQGNRNVFYIEYVCKTTGGTNTTRVEGHKLATEVAKNLARSSGRRVIIRREDPAAANKWKVFFLDVNSQARLLSEVAVDTKARAAKIFKTWQEEKHGVVCVLWPSWAPPPIDVLQDLLDSNSKQI